METNNLLQETRKWIEQNIGGDEARIDMATRAAQAALSQGKSLEEALTAAQQEASKFSELAGLIEPASTAGGMNSPQTNVPYINPVDHPVIPSPPPPQHRLRRVFCALIILLVVWFVARNIFLNQRRRPVPYIPPIRKVEPQRR